MLPSIFNKTMLALVNNLFRTKILLLRKAKLERELITRLIYTAQVEVKAV